MSEENQDNLPISEEPEYVPGPPAWRVEFRVRDLDTIHTQWLLYPSGELPSARFVPDGETEDGEVVVTSVDDLVTILHNEEDIFKILEDDTKGNCEIYDLPDGRITVVNDVINIRRAHKKGLYEKLPLRWSPFIEVLLVEFDSNLPKPTTMQELYQQILDEQLNGHKLRI